ADTVKARKADGCSEDEARRPWQVRHPLQPFDPRYFSRDTRRLFSFDAPIAAPPGTPPPPFLSANVPSANVGAAHGCDRTTTDSPQVLPLRTLLHWFRRPAEALLTREAQLSLAALKEDAPGAEE